MAGMPGMPPTVVRRPTQRTHTHIVQLQQNSITLHYVKLLHITLHYITSYYINSHYSYATNSHIHIADVLTDIYIVSGSINKCADVEFERYELLEQSN